MKNLVGCIGGFLLIPALILIVSIASPFLFLKHTSDIGHGCMANVKNQSMGLLMYTQDYDGKYPNDAQAWSESLLWISRDGSAFHCPALRKDEFGYAFDSRLIGKDLSTLADSEKTSAIFESQNRAKNANSPGTGFSTRHNGMGNVGFADGHAKSLNREAFDALPAPGWKESKAGEAKKAAEDAKR